MTQSQEMNPIITITSNECHSGATNVQCPLTVVLSAISLMQVTVEYATQAETASAGGGDYVGVSPEQHATVTIPPGQTCGQIQITIKPHAPGTPSKFFTVRLADPVGASIDQPTGEGVITIVPEGAAPIPPDPPVPHDLTATLNAATTNQNFPLGEYTVNGAVALKVSVQFNGSTVHCPPLPNGVPNFRLVAPNIVVDNFIMPTGGQLFEYEAADCTLSNFQIGVGGNPGDVVQPLKTGVGGYGAWAINGRIGVAASVGWYIQQGKSPTRRVRGENLTFEGDKKEYDIRWEVPADGPDAGKKQSGCDLVNCKFSTVGGKDTEGGRVFDDVTITGGTCMGDLRLGQSPPAGNPPTTSVGQYCNGWRISGVVYTSNGNPMAPLQVYQGVDVMVTNCTFIGYKVPIFGGDVFSRVAYSQNKCHPPAGVVGKWWAASAKATPVDGGGNVMV